MSLSVDFLSVLLFITLAQGFFIISVLILRYKRSSQESFFLFFILLVLVWFQAEFLSVRLPYDIPFNAFYGTRYGSWLALGPLFYFYVQSITDKSFRLARRHLIHLLPFLLFVWIIPLLTADFLSLRQVNYGMLSVFDPFNDRVSILQYVYSSVFVAQFGHLVIYLIGAFLSIRQYEKDLAGSYSSMNSREIAWLKMLNILLLLIVALVSVFLILFFVSRSYNRDLDYLYVIPSSVLIYLVSYRLAGVQWLRVAPTAVVKYKKSSLKTSEGKERAEELERYLAAHKPYLNNELRLEQLAEMLGMPSHHLSQVLNEHLNSTFFDFINRQRVEEAKKLIINEGELTLLEIAFKAGFNNKTTFTNAFKKFTGMTPLAFKKNRLMEEK
ncbi:MAG TPA: helix-turn-helix domain-containing protein [Chryseolinea sp.]